MRLPEEDFGKSVASLQSLRQTKMQVGTLGRGVAIGAESK